MSQPAWRWLLDLMSAMRAAIVGRPTTNPLRVTTDQKVGSSNLAGRTLVRQDVGMSTVHRVKITLKGVKPPIWRRLLVPSELTLDQVHEVFQTAMGWSGYHLYAFRIGRTTYIDMDDDWSDDAVDPASAQLGDLLGSGDKFIYEYDFGDGWEHQVVVEDVLASAGRARAVCLAGRRACPPEDVGGPWGYADFLEAIADPAHENHAELLEWIGGGFDPAAFDAAEVDNILAIAAAESGS